MTRPESCGAAGGAISLWLNVIDCTSVGGIISSFSFRTGLYILCYSNDMQYDIQSSLFIFKMNEFSST